jgi:hypothetical protein
MSVISIFALKVTLVDKMLACPSYVAYAPLVIHDLGPECLIVARRLSKRLKQGQW